MGTHTGEGPSVREAAVVGRGGCEGSRSEVAQATGETGGEVYQGVWPQPGADLAQTWRDGWAVEAGACTQVPAFPGPWVRSRAPLPAPPG